MLSIRPSHASNIIRLGIAHMAKDANIYIRRLYSLIFFAVLPKAK